MFTSGDDQETPRRRKRSDRSQDELEEGLEEYQKAKSIVARCPELTVDELRKLLTDASENKRRAALHCIGERGPALADEILPDVVALLRSDDPLTKRYAIGCLGDFRGRGAPSIPRLRDILATEKDPALIRALLIAIGSIGMEPDCVSLFTRHLCHAELNIICLTPVVLYGSGSLFDVALVATDPGSTYVCRDRAIMVLAMIAGTSKEVLMQASVDRQAAQSLMQSNPPAGILAIALQRKASDDDVLVIQKALSNPSRHVVLAALAAIEVHSLGSKTEAMLDGIIMCIDHEDSDIPFLAVRVLDNLAVKNKRAREALQRATELRNSWASAAAKRALTKHGGNSE
ncbi:MAG: HEAT repeat domain-containing protein [Planctomycetia bacterium]|nr:HEAT repeat domain-containing protein [Planctomycetia bacterium]